MTQLKTQKNAASVQDFLNSVADEQNRQDSFAILEILREVTGEEPAMWGSSMVGFGSYHYTYASGREGDWFATGFSPRKQNLTVYIMSGFERYASLMAKLGKYKTGESCLYFKRLSDIDVPTLRKLVKQSFEDMAKRTGTSGCGC